MNKEHALNEPWLVAVWPGMGAVSISAGYYLMAKLGMHLLTEFPAIEFFDLDHVEVKRGLIFTGRLPRSRLFLWSDPKEKHDLIVFIGEAQPPTNRNAFCSKLMSHVKKLGVEHVFTFAAMGTQMRPEHESRVFGAAIDRESLNEFKRLGMEILDEGKISGLNGAFLGIAAESGMRGGCLLGEISQVFLQFPFPKASLAVLEAFTSMADITLDLKELHEQAHQTEEAYEKILQSIEESEEEGEEEAMAETSFPEPEAKPLISPHDEQRLEELFALARTDRSKAYQLKRELDRLKLFHEYEDRFLDLFKKPD